jgi:hypothetical protein
MSLRDGAKGLLLDALRYQQTLDPIRPAIFQTVSPRNRVNKDHHARFSLLVNEEHALAKPAR